MTTLSPAPSLVKPRARGWIHLWSFGASVVLGATLVVLAASTVSAQRRGGHGDLQRLTISAMFGVSALYHRRTWHTARRPAPG